MDTKEYAAAAREKLAELSQTIIHSLPDGTVCVLVLADKVGCQVATNLRQHDITGFLRGVIDELEGRRDLVTMRFDNKTN